MSALNPATVSSVQPLHMEPPVLRNWASFGLPDHGWVMITDKQLCAVCPGSDSAPCVDACASDHHLPEEDRRTLGTCSHCDPAPCADACPAEAIYHTEQGVVAVDQELCFGCRFCEEACEHGALLFVDPYRTATPPHGLKGYTPGQPTGMLPATVAKCTLCSDQLLHGRMPVCASACALDAIWVGNLDRNTATNGQKVVRLSDLLEQHRLEIVAPGRRILYLVGPR